MDSLPSRMWGTAIMMPREDEADVSPLECKSHPREEMGGEGFTKKY